jgi:hypothetical protein
MATPDDTLRALIRLIPPARALKEDLEKSIHLEIYAGTGDLAIRSFNGLQASIAAITNEPYVATLALIASESAGDKEKVSLALLAVGQLTAYLEGQTGLVNLSANRSVSYRTAPEIHICDNSGVSPEALDKMLGIGETALEGKRSD